MNIYYIKQTSVPLSNKFYISNDKNEDLFIAKSDSVLAIFDMFLSGIFSIGHTLNIMTLNGTTVLSVKKETSFMFEKFKLIKDNSIVAVVNQEKKLTKPIIKASYGEDEFIVKGDILAKEFIIRKNSKVCAQVNKTRIDIKDRYKLTIYEDDSINDEFYIALVLIIDSSFHK